MCVRCLLCGVEGTMCTTSAEIETIQRECDDYLHQTRDECRFRSPYWGEFEEKTCGMCRNSKIKYYYLHFRFVSSPCPSSLSLTPIVTLKQHHLPAAAASSDCCWLSNDKNCVHRLVDERTRASQKLSPRQSFNKNVHSHPDRWNTTMAFAWHWIHFY